MKLTEDRFAETHGTTRDDAGYDASDGIALSLHREDEVCHLLGDSGIRTAHSVGFDETEVELRPVTVAGDSAHLLCPRLDLNAELAQAELALMEKQLAYKQLYYKELIEKVNRM